MISLREFIDDNEEHIILHFDETSFLDSGHITSKFSESIKLFATLVFESAFKFHPSFKSIISF